MKNIYFFLLVILFCCISLQCGKKGPLILEPQLNPGPIQNFQITQIGDSIKLQWNFQPNFSDKKMTPFQVEKIKKIYIYYSEKEITFEKFRKKSTLLKKLTLEDLSPAPILSTTTTSLISESKTGFKIEDIKKLSYFIEIPFKTKELDMKSHYFAVQYSYQKKRSPLSRIAFIQTMVPVKPVAGLNIAKEKKMIKLTWKKPEADENGNLINNIAGYFIYKKIQPEEADTPDTQVPSSDSEINFFTRVNKEKVLVEYYEDLDTGTNGQYTYYVSAVLSNQIETAPSDKISVQITDIYPPETPPNLVCFRASDHLFLTWKPVTDSDFAFYRVYRKELESEDFQLIADNVNSTSYKDKDVKKGRTYTYKITAVDKKNNESDPSSEVAEQFK